MFGTTVARDVDQSNMNLTRTCNGSTRRMQVVKRKGQVQAKRRCFVLSDGVFEFFSRIWLNSCGQVEAFVKKAWVGLRVWCLVVCKIDLFL